MPRIATLIGCLLAGLALAPPPAAAQGLARLELHPLETVTLSQPQILRGQTDGKPVTIAGELRLPRPGTDKLPAIILVHGSGGVGGAADLWARELNGIGLAVFILDSFTGRGITSTVEDQSQLDSIAMMTDVFRALARLSAHPRIDAEHIAVMGFSKGAVAAVYSGNARFQALLGGGRRFAAHIGLYTPCNIAYRDDQRTTGAPIRMFHGIADDYVSIEPCRAYVARLREAGADVTLTDFPDAHHSYDNPAIVQPIKFPNGQTTRNCHLREGDDGAILNARTGQPYALAADPCVERGPQVAYNAAAHQATVAAVKGFLTERFRLKP